MDSFRGSLISLFEPNVLVSRIPAAVLKRDRMIVAFGLAGVTVLSWAYLILHGLENASGSRDRHGG